MTEGTHRGRESHPGAHDESGTDAVSQARDAPLPAELARRFQDQYDDDPTPPPARPVMSNRSGPPISRRSPPPRSIRAARVAWLTSFALGGIGVLVAFLSRTSVTAELTREITRLAPSRDEISIDSLVAGIYRACMAGLGLVIAIEAILLTAMLKQRTGARWAQLALLFLHAGVALVASAFLAVGDWGELIEPLIIAGFLAALAGWLLSLVPAARRWFRMRDETQPMTFD